MSGGEFDYNCFKISQFAEELQHKIETNLNKDDYGYSYNMSDEVLEKLKAAQKLIELAGKLAREIEWLYSGDHGEESFVRLYDKIMKEYK